MTEPGDDGQPTEHTGVRIDAAWLAGFRARRDVALRAGLQPVAGAPELVAAVAARYGERVACASGADRAKTEMQLDITGLRRHFGDRVFSGQETPRTKPAPDVYLLAAATQRGWAVDRAPLPPQAAVDPSGCSFWAG